MPIVVPAQSQSSSSAQTVATAQIFDYLQTDQGVAISGAEVRCVLAANVAVAISPIVMVRPTELVTETDGNGFFSFNVIPNNNLNPANTTYTISTPFRQYRIYVPSGGPYQTTAFGIIVDTPVALAPAVTGLTGQLTIQAGGLIVAAGGAHIHDGLFVDTGTFTIATGGFTMQGPLTLTAAASQIVPGSASFSVRDTANANNNLLVSDSGVVTARTGFTLTAGLMTLPAASIADAALSSNVPLKNAANTFSALQTISSGGLAVTGGITAVTGGVTATAGNLVATAGNLVFAAASAKIVPGATSLLVRNNADSATNLGLTDAGLGTFRNAVEVPYAAAATLPTHSYGTVPVKIDDQLLVGAVASITFAPNPLPTGFRHLIIEWYARGDTAATSTTVLMRFNNDSGANYDLQSLSGSAAVASASETLGSTSMAIGNIPAATATASYFGEGEAKVKHYNGTTGNKLVISNTSEWTANGSGNGRVQSWGSKWRTTATAVTRIDLLPGAGNFVAGSIFTLWGIP